MTAGTRQGEGSFSRSSRLALLGVVHRDPRGYGRLKDFLHFFQPDLIFLELSPFAWSFRRRHQGFLLRTLRRRLTFAAARRGTPLGDALRHPQICAVARQLALPYEYRGTRAHVRRTGAELVLADDSAFSRQCIARWPELISVDNLAALLDLPATVPDIDKIRRRAVKRMEASQEELDPGHRYKGEARSWISRERRMVRRIREGLAVFEPEAPLYVGGWQHLVPSGSFPGLRELLDIPVHHCHIL